MSKRVAPLTGAALGALLAAIFAAASAWAGDGFDRYGEAVLAENTARGASGSANGAPADGVSFAPASNRGGGGATLEIAPQPGLGPSNSPAGAISAGVQPKSDRDDASVERDLSRGDEAWGPEPRPYLGITVGGRENSHPASKERGIEIASVDPGSPAEQAGLEGRLGMTAAGAFLGPLNSLAMPLLRKTGSLGHAGDLIVAVDDRRVRTREELEAALSALRPGQTVYLTVVRFPAGQARKTLKISVKLGSTGQYATAAPQAVRPPAH